MMGVQCIVVFCNTSSETRGCAFFLCFARVLWERREGVLAPDDEAVKMHIVP